MSTIFDYIISLRPENMLKMPTTAKRAPDVKIDKGWLLRFLIGIFIFGLTKNLNQPGHEPSHHRLGKGGQTSPPPISKYFSEIFSPSHIKLANKTRIWTLNRSSDRRNSRILN